MITSSPSSSRKQSTTPWSSRFLPRRSAENFLRRTEQGKFELPPERISGRQHPPAGRGAEKLYDGLRVHRLRFSVGDKPGFPRRSISRFTLSRLLELPKSIYCKTRCVAVPRSAPVTGRPARVKSGILKGRGRAGARGCASSSSSARPFSSVAVTLEGRASASRKG